MFNNILYKQKDSVAIGSTLGPTIENVFLLFYEMKWLEQCLNEFKPVFDRSYVDDIFMFLAVLVLLYLARVRFPRNESIASIVWKRYSGEILNTIRKFGKVDYKLKERKLDINFRIKCQRKDVIPNFLKFRLASKDLRNSVTYIKCQHNLYKSL